MSAPAWPLDVAASVFAAASPPWPWSALGLGFAHVPGPPARGSAGAREAGRGGSAEAGRPGEPSPGHRSETSASEAAPAWRPVPKDDILGLVNGTATLVNASKCIGHGRCASECPVQAIRLVFGTAERGVDLPEVDEHFETARPGVHVVGELGGHGPHPKCAGAGAAGRGASRGRRWPARPRAERCRRRRHRGRRAGRPRRRGRRAGGWIVLRACSSRTRSAERWRTTHVTRS